MCCLLTSLAIWSSAWSSADTLVFPRRLPFAPGLSIFACCFLLLITGPHNVIFFVITVENNCKITEYDYGGQRAINFFTNRWYDHKNYVNLFFCTLASLSIIKYGLIQIWWNEEIVVDYLYTIHTDDYYKNMYTHSQLIFLRFYSLVIFFVYCRMLNSPLHIHSGWGFLSRQWERRCWNYHTKMRRKRRNEI